MILQEPINDTFNHVVAYHTFWKEQVHPSVKFTEPCFFHARLSRDQFGGIVKKNGGQIFVNLLDLVIEHKIDSHLRVSRDEYFQLTIVAVNTADPGDDQDAGKEYYDTIKLYPCAH